MAPTVAQDEDFRRWFAGFLRLGASPGAWLALRRMNWESDVRHVLPAIRVPTLVVHRRGDLAVPIGNGRYLAEHIPGAQFVELPGDDHIWFVGDADGLVDIIQRFLARLEPAAEPDRVLMTVLALTAGDRAASSPPLVLSPAQQALARRELAHFRGQEVHSVNGGLLAAFDGPVRAIRCAFSLRDALQQTGMRIRAGLHTGECEIVDGRLRGATVAMAGRIAAYAAAGQVLASSTVVDLVAGAELVLRDAGRLADGDGEARSLFVVA